jgi:ABC-2 type transport system ATP-binding protein
MLAQNLSKTYKRKQILDSIDWQLGTGVYGLIGPSGAGKSMLLQILSGTLRPSLGDVIIEGVKLSGHPEEYREKIGYLPQNFSICNEMTVNEFMNNVAMTKGCTQRTERNKQVQNILCQVELRDSAHRKTKSLPLGMMKRLGMAQALVNNPKVLLLDEPTVGLSPLERDLLLQRICQYGKTHTVIFSSKNAMEIMHCCRNVGIIQKGRILFNGSLREIAHMAAGTQKTTRIHNGENVRPAAFQKAVSVNNDNSPSSGSLHGESAPFPGTEIRDIPKENNPLIRNLSLWTLAAQNNPINPYPYKRQTTDMSRQILAFMEGYQKIIGGYTE